MEVKREGEVWDIINRERKRRGGLNEDIDMEEWKDYFIDVLGIEGRVVIEGEKGGGRGEGRERGRRRNILERNKRGIE